MIFHGIKINTLATAREAAVAIAELWQRALELHQRVVGLKLESKLRVLGSDAAQAYLKMQESIPIEQAVEFRRLDEADRPRPPPPPVESGIDRELAAGVSLEKALADALRAQPQDALALAPPMASWALNKEQE